MATVMLSTNNSVTNAMPASIAARVMIKNSAGQYLGHDRQRELPRERLRSGWQDPHSRDERLNAHCASDPFGRLRSIGRLNKLQ